MWRKMEVGRREVVMNSAHHVKIISQRFNLSKR